MEAGFSAIPHFQADDSLKLVAKNQTNADC